MTIRKVFAIGLPRCGTTSVHDLFITLGLNSQHLNMWMVRIIGAGNFNFDPIDKFDAFSDSPFPYLWKDLFYRYPRAQFILNTRSEDRWLKSIELSSKMNIKLGVWQDTPENRTHRNYLAMLFGTPDFDETAWRIAFRRHHLEVRSFFMNRHPEKFLEVSIEDDDLENAQKIAKFLNMPLPEGTRMARRNSGGVDAFGEFAKIVPAAVSPNSN